MSDVFSPKTRLTFKSGRSQPQPSHVWPILVVDDDPQVHIMTRVLLRDYDFQGRGFQVISAYSAAEARTILADRDDIPVILLDVVMETDDAGLGVARFVREELGNQRLRIILRTGQPGEAPERRVMLDYDINDYRSKTELTAQKMFTTVVASLRSWIHISTIETLNANLEARVEERTSQLQEARHFAERLVEMLPNPVWFKDGQGRFQLYNRAFREFFAIEADAWRGRTAAEVMDEHGRDEEVSTDASLAEGRCQGDRLDYETAVADMTGLARTLMVSKSLLRHGDGVPLGILSVATDITERKGLERELRQLAVADPLTGAFNRRHFLSVAVQEMERATRYGSALSVMMIDIDHFKQVNDRHGHAMGDEVLRKAAQICRNNLREVDVFARLGGEEFAVLLPETEAAGARGLAERLRRAVAEMRVPVGLEDVRISVSIGIAGREDCEVNFDHLLGRADGALYVAKQAGCDRVEIAPSRG